MPAGLGLSSCQPEPGTGKLKQPEVRPHEQATGSDRGLIAHQASVTHVHHHDVLRDPAFQALAHSDGHLSAGAALTEAHAVLPWGSHGYGGSWELLWGIVNAVSPELGAER